MNCGIYRIVCMENLKSYYGSTNNWTRRKSTHIKELNRNIHTNIFLQNAWNKYGQDAFRFDFIESVEEQKLLEREQCYLDMMFDGNKKLGFNICKIAGCGKVMKGKDNPNYGKTASQETRKKISDALKGHKNNLGKKHSQETKDKLAKYKGELHHAFGTHQTEDRKLKQSIAMKGRTSHRKGKKLTEEHKQNISLAKRKNK